MVEDFPQRQSPRLKDYDYSQNGAYFITICTHNRHHYFGYIDNQHMTLNLAGETIQQLWQNIPDQFPEIECDYSVVMPNHLHGILMIQGESEHSIVDVMQWFKAITTHHYGIGVKEKELQPYDGKLWQRSFHDHIVRNEVALNKLREYVIYNPALWEKDTFFEG